MTDIRILNTDINIQDCIEAVRNDAGGGIDIFIGTVRNQTKGKTVLRLEFEAYESMALKEMQQIALAARAKWDVQHIVIHHRTGVLEVGDVPVVIAVSAAHRAAAFEACRFIIDSLKESVPIWKKEVFSDGEVWVNAHP